MGFWLNTNTRQRSWSFPTKYVWKRWQHLLEIIFMTSKGNQWDGLGRTKKTGTDSYINTRMLGQTFKMLGRTLWRTFIDPIYVVFIGHNSNWQLYWAQKTDAVQFVRHMSKFDNCVRPVLHYKSCVFCRGCLLIRTTDQKIHIWQQYEKGSPAGYWLYCPFFKIVSFH